MTASSPHDAWDRLDAVPRERLAQTPTALVPAPQLRDAIGGGPLWLKRDDLLGFGFGGNKVRGLELLVADARRQGADRLITGAGVQSNHVRAAAAAAAWAGLAMTAVYWGTAPGRPSGNYQLTLLLGAEPWFSGDDDRAAVDEHIERFAAEERARGHRPYPIPRGGSCPLGVLGHALAARELAAQCDALDLSPGAIVLAVGTGTTQAGLLLGARLLGRDWRIEGVTVSRTAAELRERIAMLVRESGRLLDAEVEIGPDEVVIHDAYIGGGYGVPTEAGNAAVELGARRQGVFLDPTYTGKAMAGYRALVAAGHFEAGRPVVFLHTGGEPTLLAESEHGS